MTAEPIGSRLAEQAERVADGDIRFVTAEICTGGQLAAALAGHSTLGSHLERGYIVYSVDAKCEMLGISRALAERSQGVGASVRSEEHTSELQSLMRISYAVFCLKKNNNISNTTRRRQRHKHRSHALMIYLYQK